MITSFTVAGRVALLLLGLLSHPGGGNLWLATIWCEPRLTGDGQILVVMNSSFARVPVSP
jgi:hypothetical protein